MENRNRKGGLRINMKKTKVMVTGNVSREKKRREDIHAVVVAKE